MSKAAFEARVSDAHYTVQAEYERSSKQMMRAMVPATPAARILDVGCGTGLNASFLAAAGHTIVGVDVSPVAIDRFRANGFEGFVADIETQNLAVKDDSFDIVYASEVIEHCVDTRAFLEELFRVLKPGGTLFLSTPNSAFWAYRVLGILGRTASDYQHPGHVRFFSRRGLRRAVEAVGFKVTSVAGRHMYLLVGSHFDAIGHLLRRLGFSEERRFATGGHFWQLSKFAARASGFWADTLFVVA